MNPRGRQALVVRLRWGIGLQAPSARLGRAIPAPGPKAKAFAAVRGGDFLGLAVLCHGAPRQPHACLLGQPIRQSGVRQGRAVRLSRNDSAQPMAQRGGRQDRACALVTRSRIGVTPLPRATPRNEGSAPAAAAQAAASDQPSSEPPRGMPPQVKALLDQMPADERARVMADAYKTEILPRLEQAGAQAQAGGQAVLFSQRTIGIVGINDHHARLVEREMALDQRERSLADGAKADHDKRAVNAGVNGVGHGVAFQCLVVLAAIQSIKASKTPEMTKVRWMMTIHFKVSLVTA